MLYAIVAAAFGGWFSIMCLSVFAHRSIAHRAVTLHPVVAHVMRFWLWFSTGTPTRRWVAVHRKHHVYTDGEGDPHSPVISACRASSSSATGYYRREAMKPRDDRAVRQGLPERLDRAEHLREARQPRPRARCSCSTSRVRRRAGPRRATHRRSSGSSCGPPASSTASVTRRLSQLEDRRRRAATSCRSRLSSAARSCTTTTIAGRARRSSR